MKQYLQSIQKQNQQQKKVEILTAMRVTQSSCPSISISASGVLRRAICYCGHSFIEGYKNKLINDAIESNFPCIIKLADKILLGSPPSVL
jgi:hypothetical protein